MSTKAQFWRAAFTGDDGANYTIEIGTGTTARPLTLAASPLTLELAGGSEHKFPGVKSVTAHIRVLASADLSEMYTEGPQGRQVLVSKSLNGVASVLFWGYLIPWEWEVPYTCTLDEVEIVAVDALTSLKYNKYSMHDTTVGASSYTGMEYIYHACAYLGGVAQIRKSYMLGTDTNYFKAYKIEEDAFLPADWTSDDDKITWLEVIEAICNHFAFTAVLWGRVLYLIDYSFVKSAALVEGEAGYGSYTPQDMSTWSVVTEALMSVATGGTITSALFTGTDARKEIKQAYSAVKVSIEDDTTPVLLNDLTDKDRHTVPVLGYALKETLGGYIFLRQYSTPKDYTLTAPRGIDGTAISNPSITPVPNTGSANYDDWHGCVPLEMGYVNAEGTTDGMSASIYLWLRSRGTGASAVTVQELTQVAAARHYLTSQLFGYLRITGSAFFQDTTAYVPDIDGGGHAGFDSIQAKLRVGRLWWNGTVWDTEDTFFAIYFGDDTSSNGFKDVSTTTKARELLTTGQVVPGITTLTVSDRARKAGLSTETGTLEFSLMELAGSVVKNVWIKSLTVSPYEGLWYETKSEDKRTLQSSYADALEVKVKLAGSHAGLPARIWSNTIAGWLPDRLAVQYKVPRKAFKLPLRGMWEPWRRLHFDGDTTEYTVDALEYDVRDNSTYISILE